MKQYRWWYVPRACGSVCTCMPACRGTHVVHVVRVDVLPCFSCIISRACVYVCVFAVRCVRMQDWNESRYLRRVG